MNTKIPCKGKENLSKTLPYQYSSNKTYNYCTKNKIYVKHNDILFVQKSMSIKQNGNIIYDYSKIYI